MQTICCYHIRNTPLFCMHDVHISICFSSSKHSYFNSSAGLPDAASIEAASWVEPDNDRTVLIDASTAFRVDDNWDYGFPGR